MTDPERSGRTGTHITYLRPDGRGKADGPSPKVMLGRRGVIRLSADEEVTLGIGIAEGIETSLAVMQRLDWRPIWLATCAGAVASVPVLPGVDEVVVFPDCDRAGMRAAEACARRWAAAGRDATIWTPERGDWRDAACRGAREMDGIHDAPEARARALGRTVRRFEPMRGRAVGSVRVYTASDAAHAPPRRWLLRNLLAEGDLALCFGAPKGGNPSS